MTIRLPLVLAVLALSLVLPSAFAPAWAQNSGDACTAAQANAWIVTGTDPKIRILCDGTQWRIVEKIDLSGAATSRIKQIITLGTDSAVCSTDVEGTQRYNGTSKCMEFCNGTSWGCIAPVACPDVTPNAFSFTDLVNQTASTQVTSNILQVSGFGCSVNISVSGTGSPQFRTCSDAACSTVVQDWSGAAWIDSGQYVQLRLTTSGTGGATNSATVIVGNTADVWSATTLGDCTGSPAVGTLCPDGSVYVGQTPDGNVKMYTTRCETGQSWSGSACTGAITPLSWNNGTTSWTVTGMTDNNTGEANTAGLMAIDDAGSVYAAANYCDGLNMHGNTDWYLPSRGELIVMSGNYSSISSSGNFAVGGWYLSSTEESNIKVKSLNLQSGSGGGGSNKNSTAEYTRCVRREVDTEPAAFNFLSKINQSLATLVTSSIQQITGLDAAAKTFVLGSEGTPQFRTCVDATCTAVIQNWTTAGTVADGDFVQLRMYSSGDPSTGRAMKIVIGQSYDDWWVTTAAGAGDCTGSPTVGTVCADGTVYAGLSPDGPVKMYTTRCDVGMSWNGTTCTGVVATKAWNNGNSTGYVNTSQTSFITGEANTTAIVALDSDSGTGGTQPHIAAAHCDTLNENGQTDWYLPARDELNLLYAGKSAIGGFNTATYFSSSEFDNASAWRQAFSDGSQDLYGGKNQTYAVRCVRK